MWFRKSPPPALATRRGFAVAGLVPGIVAAIAVPAVVILFHDRFPAVMEALRQQPVFCLGAREERL